MSKNYLVTKIGSTEPLEVFETFALAIRYTKLYFSFGLDILHKQTDGKLIKMKFRKKVE